MNRFEERLTPVLKDFVQKGTPGCALLVAQGGETLYEHYEGFADVDARKPIAPDTIYRIYSMSKVITCTAALMLYERGLFALNDPLGEYLPEFRESRVFETSPRGELSERPAARPIRIRDLFTMTSGYPYPGEGMETGRRIAGALAELETAGVAGDGASPLRSFAKALAKIPLAFDPGAHWMYGMSHDILGALIETLSGKPFGIFLQEEIFAPLGMADTAFRITEGKRSRLCRMYDIGGGKAPIANDRLDKDFQPNAVVESGGGGLLSTLGDYTRFANVLALGEYQGVRLLSPHTLGLMASNHLNARQLADLDWPQLAGYGYGLGVRVLIDPAAGGCASSPGEFGWMGMAGTLVFIDPAEKLAIVYMQQTLPNQEAYHLPRVRDAVYGCL